MENGAVDHRFDPRDPNDLEQLLKAYRPGLIFFIQRLVGDPDTAEDLAIDSFLELLIHPLRYNGRSSMKTYLFMIGRSKALNYLNRRARLSPEPIPENHPDDTSLEEQFLADERRRALHKALNTLPEEMRAAVHLVYFEELTYRQTAQVLKKTEKQVDNLIYRAKTALRNQLRKDDLFEKS